MFRLIRYGKRGSPCCLLHFYIRWHFFFFFYLNIDIFGAITKSFWIPPFYYCAICIFCANARRRNCYRLVVETIGWWCFFCSVAVVALLLYAMMATPTKSIDSETGTKQLISFYLSFSVDIDNEISRETIKEINCM